MQQVGQKAAMSRVLAHWNTMQKTPDIMPNYIKILLIGQPLLVPFPVCKAKPGTSSTKSANLEFPGTTKFR